MIKSIGKRWLSLVLALAMLLGLAPQIAVEASAANLDTGVSGLSASYDAGTWSRSGSVITGSVTTTSQSGCTGDTYTAQTGTLTLKNTTSSTRLLSFDYELSLGDGAVKMNGTSETVSPGSKSVKLTANETYTIQLTSCSTAVNTTTVRIMNLALEEDRPIQTVFVPAENGSYTVNGAAVLANQTVSHMTSDTIHVAAVPDAGYKFSGWYDLTAQSFLSTAAETDLYVQDADHQITAKFITKDTAMFSVSGTMFPDLNQAINYAVSNNKSTIILAEDGVLPAGSYEIPSGKTLLIPFDAAGTLYTATPTVVYNSHVMPTAFRTLTMAPGSSITVKNGGAVCLGSKLSSSGQMNGWNGTPTGPDGRIKMNAGSAITLESGANLYCWGYIYGSGQVEAKSGSTVYEAFQIKDWRGGTATSNIYKYAFIFSQYYIQNIEVPLKINAGAAEKLYSSVNASGSAYPISATFLGSDGMFTVSSGYVVKDYLETSDRLHIAVNGNVSVAPMTISGIPMIGSISTSNYILPINGNIGIDLQSGTTTITQDIEMLPGTEIHVGRQANLQISSGKKVYVYDESDWGNFTGTARLYPIGYSVANGTTAVRNAAGLKDAQIDVNGTLTVAGSLFTSAGGANLTSSQGTEGSSGKIVFSTAPAASSTINEMEGNSTKTSVSFTAPKLRNGDETHSATVDTGTSTWYYDKDGEHWYRFLVDFLYNGNRIARDYYCENNDVVTYDASWLTGLGASVTSGSASAAVSGSKVNVTNVTSNAAVTLTGTAAKYIPVFLLNERQYQNYRFYTGNTLSETRTVNDETWYVAAKADAALAVGSAYAAPTDAFMGVSAEHHNAIVWNLTGLSAVSGRVYNGTVPVGETAEGEVYIYGFYTGAVAYNSYTDQYYPTLAAAMAEVTSGEGTVRLIAECGSFEEEPGTTIYSVPEGVDLTLDLNGFTAPGRIVNSGELTLDLNGGSLNYRTGATAAASAYQGAAALTNSGSLIVRDTVGGGRITADAVSNAGVPNHAAVIRNCNGGTLEISDATLEGVQDVNGYFSVILNDRSAITTLRNVTLLSPRGYAIFNYGGAIQTVDSCTADVAYGIYNRNVRGSNTLANGYNIANYGVIDTIKDSNVTAGQYAIHNNAVIHTLENTTFVTHPDSAQVNTYGTTAVNLQGNTPAYTVYNNNAWWYDSAVWKRTDSNLTRTDAYKEDAACRPTIDTITDCKIYAENTSAYADHGCALYNNGGIINTISGNTEIKTYKHPDNAKSISSNYALRNTAGGVIRSITGSVDASATGCCAVYNDGQFTTQIQYAYSDKVGGIVTHQQETYGQPSEISSITAAGTWSVGSYYALMNGGYISGINAPGLTLTGNYNVLYNATGGANSSLDYTRAYTDPTAANTEYQRTLTYTKNLEKGSRIDAINGITIRVKGAKAYQGLNNQGRIGTVTNVDVGFAEGATNNTSSYPLFLNGDSSYAAYTETRRTNYTDADNPKLTVSAGIVTRYDWDYTYATPTIDSIENLTVTSIGTYAFRNAGVIGTLKDSTVSGTQHALHNSANGPYTERQSLRYYSGSDIFGTNKSTSELTYHSKRNPAVITNVDHCTVTSTTSTYAMFNSGHLGTLANSTLKAGASTAKANALFNGNSQEREYTYNLEEILYVTANSTTSCTAYYGTGGETKVITYDYEAPSIDLIGAGNTFTATTPVISNTGRITAIDSGDGACTTVTGTGAKGSGIYNYSACLDARTTTTPYTAASSANASGTAGTAVNDDTLLPGAQIDAIRNLTITANGYGILNGDASAGKLPTIAEIGAGTEVHANCTTAGYHAVYNQANAKIAAITGGVFAAAKDTTNAYKNDNTNPEHATLISGGDFKGAASTRANAVYEPDNTDRQTYPVGKSLSEAPETVTLHDGSTDTGYYFVGSTVTVTFDANGGDGAMEPQIAGAGKAFTLNANTFTREGWEFDGWNTAADGTGAAYADCAELTLNDNLTLYAQWKQHTHTWGAPIYSWNADNTQVTATVTCQENPAHVETETVDVTAAETTPATCTAAGVRTLTATFANPLFTTQIKTEAVPALGHAWSDWTQTTAPTCTEKGVETRTCSRCDATETRPVEALGHDLVHHEAQAATCTEIGWKAYDTCTRCDYSTYEELPALGHDFGEWAVTTEPTCTQEGVETRTCSRCDAAETRPVDALGHTPAEAVTEHMIEPTCTADGGYDSVVYCAVCHEELSRVHHMLDALGHDFGEWAVTTEPTCTEEGVETRTCSRCDAKETRPVEALGHDLVHHEGQAPTCSENGWKAYDTCTRCDYSTYEAIEATGHTPAEPVEENRAEATCTEAGSYDEVVYCSVCHAELSRETKTVAALGHAWSDWTRTTAPTCTEAGVETRTCTRCDATETRPVEALGHDLVHHEAQAATCTEIGWKAYDTCTRCDYSTYEELPALGHDFGEWAVTTEPTCTQEGVETRTCSRCDATETRPVDALGHDYETTVTAPTCTEQGYTTYTCSRCGDSYVDDYTDPLGHDFGEWTVTTEPTCTEEGVETRTCSRCDAVETRPVEALGHDYKAAVTAPTCTEQGYTTYTCSRCGDSYVDDYTDPLGHDFGEWTVTTEPTCTQEGVETRTCSRCDATETRPVEALGHDYKAAVTAPTCTEQGYTTYTCSRCGDSYVDDYTDALGHDFGEWTVTTEPTCTEEGVETRTCSRCDAAETRPVEALGHDYETTVTAPTCTEQGYTTYTCSRCGDSYVDDYTDALGHDFGEWTVTTEPTCTEEGVETRTCSRCDATETRPVEALGHDLVHHEGQAPTCSENGWKAYDTCTRCDYTTYEAIEATGHTPAEPVIENNVAPTCTEAGSYDSVIYCAECGEELSRETVTVPALGHNYGEPEYVWAADNSTVTATAICANDETHVLTETVNTTYEVTQAPTADIDGVGTWTAVFTNEAFETQTKTEALPATGPTEPIEDSDLTLSQIVKLGAEMIVRTNLKKDKVDGKYESFYIELITTDEQGNEINTRYSLDNGLTNGNSNYMVYYDGFKAKMMRTEYVFQVHAFDANGQEYVGPELRDSMQNFLLTVLRDEESGNNKRTLAADMLNYGAAAQTYLQYDVEHLANEAGLSAEDIALLNTYATVDVEPVANSITSTGSGAEFVMSASMKNRIILKLRAQLGDAGENVKLRVTNQATNEVEYVDTTKNNNNYTALFDNVGASKMRTRYNFVMVNGDTELTQTMDWSMAAFLMGLHDDPNSSDAIKDLSLKMLKYGDSAAAYLADPEN